MSAFDAAWNLAWRGARRLDSARKVVVRASRRRARGHEQQRFAREAAEVDRAIRQVAAGTTPIVAGPWLAEVGYEVLYWIPFLRWFCDAHRIPRERLVVLSRGGMEPLYREFASRYVDIFDLTTPERLAAGNQARRAEQEGGGQKQSAASALDEALIGGAREALGLASARLLHPSLMFRLFRHVWHGNLPYDLLWRRTRYARVPLVPRTFPGLPPRFIAVKLYAGPALSRTPETVAAVRRVVSDAASHAPVVVLDTELGLDEHCDIDLSGIPGVTSAGAWMSARTNLDVQTAIIAQASLYIGTCGGLAWTAPFLGTPTVAIHDNDDLLAPHLFVERQASRRVGAARFSVLDLSVATLLGPGVPSVHAATSAAPPVSPPADSGM